MSFLTDLFEGNYYAEIAEALTLNERKSVVLEESLQELAGLIVGHDGVNVVKDWLNGLVEMGFFNPIRHRHHELSQRTNNEAELLRIRFGLGLGMGTGTESGCNLTISDACWGILMAR